ncbi:RNA polymerase I-specific transcription initiation factor RRN10 [Candida viswanathii]|uniref:RNA polymerase I-specific transcription initiation factor RRN10 n=1 Tax=Candida viswanathii TaxID=5486 RepID=A0A367YB20_9ASCO|nr:RNA polymerase I-specific transcription initiation factor RRN10 [Candida viswanathii]
MNISENGEKLLKTTNVYSACNGEYHRGQRLNRKYIEESKDHELIRTKRGLRVVIDKDARDSDKVFISEGRTVPPDEILDAMKPDSLKIPMKLREDFKDDGEMGQVSGLPDSDLLKAIHYFVSKKYDKVVDKKRRKRMVQELDETALIAMGLLVESWCDEFVTDEVAKMFTKEYPKEEPSILQEDDEEEEEEVVSEGDERESDESDA